MEDVSYLLEWRISENVESNLKCGDDSGDDDDVVANFIVPDEISSKSSNEHSDRDDNDFIVTDNHCEEAEGSSHANSDWKMADITGKQD